MDSNDPSSSPSLSPPGRRRFLSRAWIAVFVLVWAGVLLLMVFGPSASSTPEISYSTFLNQVTADQVKNVKLHHDSGQVEGIHTDGTKFTAQGPPGGIPDVDIKLLDDHKVARDYTGESSDWLGTLLLYLLPVVLIIGFFVWMGRRAQGQLSGMTAFGRSRARVHSSERPETTFADVAGYDSVKQEISEIVEFLQNPERFQAIGAHIPKGVLLVGPPGTGKTLFARAIAGEAGVPFLSITGSEFLEMFVGVGAARVRDLFDTARKQHPCIMFVDEIDAIGRKRGAGWVAGRTNGSRRSTNSSRRWTASR